ncbi:rhomboid family intramembrane serine protease [Mesorhizobium escarrei]|uniref:rhomboid family intramembrane serine protease n=1 Tax=Mesorhizobium escarrei TaxID=666018 RepID=UPI0020A79B95|nr:rhomboid family intramembrane serine protease [Mesorhizobium escarrei]
MSWIWAIGVILAWVVVATSLGQPLWAQQSSQDLVAFGAIKGENFSFPQTWRLLASQWLHVKFPHMLFNALMIASVGQAAEARFGWRTALAVGLIGGTLAQLVTVYSLPDAFISGASQAYLVLCGLVLVTGAIRSFGWWMAIAGVLVGVGLDLFVSSDGAIKPGHLTGLAFGLVSGIALRISQRAVQV